MKNKFHQILFFLLIIFSACYATEKKTFTGTTLEGKQVKLSDFEGKIVLLDFWASWCPPCRAEMPELIKFYRKHKKDDFVLITVNIDDKKSNMKKFLRGLYPIPNFPMIWDSEKKIPATFDIGAMPTSIIIDKTGKERFRHSGFKMDYIKKFEEELRLLKSEKKES